MSDCLVPNPVDRIERNYKLLADGLSLAEQASDTTCPLRQVTALLRKALAVDGVGIVWSPPNPRKIWYLEADCGDPGLAAELAALKLPHEWPVVRQVLQTGRAMRLDDDGSLPAPVLSPGGIRIRHLAALPIRSAGGIQAVALTVNLKNEPFDDLRVRVFQMVCACLALRLENEHLLREVNDAAAGVASFHLAKDRVIQRFSHELKTPLAVLIACVKLLQRRLAPRADAYWQTVLARAQRSLQRLLNLEYELEDILREQGEDNAAPSPVLDLNAGDGQKINNTG